MDSIYVLVALSLGSQVVNLSHWRFRVGETFMPLATSGWQVASLVVLGLATGVTAALSLARLVPSLTSMVALFSFVTVVQVIAVWNRHMLRAADPTAVRVPVSAWATWSPFQSPEVRDIYKHLEIDERLLLVQSATQWGRQIASWFAIPLGIACFLFCDSATLGFVVVAVIAGCTPLFLTLMRAHQKRVRKILCATKYAQTRGYRPDTLRVFAFPWSRAESSA